MSAVDVCFAYPWVAEVLGNYEAAVDGKQKAVPAQVVEFVKMQNTVEDSQCPAAVVHISDRKFYIRAVITKEAKQRFEEEEEHFTFTDIKGKIIILKEFTVQFKAEEDLKNCEFYLRIQRFDIFPMETDSVKLFNCNRHPEIQKKTRTLWQDHMEELCMKDTGCSDGPLNQYLMVMNEEGISLLKNTVLECLSLHERDQQPTTSRTALQPAASLRMAGWKTDRKKSQAIFSVPLSLLIIPAEEVVALNNLPGEDSVPTQISISSPLHEDQGSESKIQPELLPWDDISFQCQSIASSSTETQDFPAHDQNFETEHNVDHTEEADHALPDSSTPDDLLPLEKYAEESNLRLLSQDAVEHESLSLFSPSSNYSCRSMTLEPSAMCRSPVSVGQTCEIDCGRFCVPKSLSVDYVKSTASWVSYNLPEKDFQHYSEKWMCNKGKVLFNASTLSSKMKSNASSSDFFGSEKKDDVAIEKGKRASKRKHLTEDAFEELGTVSQNRSHKASGPRNLYKNAKGKIKESPTLQKPMLEFLGCQRNKSKRDGDNRYDKL